MPAKPITRFRLAYDFLSNFYPVLITLDGLDYLSAEAAYQAYKCESREDRRAFARISADEAKRLGRKIAIRPDWDVVKLDVMRRVVRAKFEQHPNLAYSLLETDDAQLIEGNSWHDVYWGVDVRTGEGENHLGRILMDLRREFQKSGLPESNDAWQKAMIWKAGDGIELRFGDGTEIVCDCVVNATDASFSGGNSLEMALYRAAGPELLEACHKLDQCSVTEARLTAGYRLPARAVLHTVGPRYGTEGAAGLLLLTYRNALDLAAQQGIHSIAFPAISTGRFSYPKQAATRIAVQAVRDWTKQHPQAAMQVIFFCADMGIYNGFLCALQAEERGIEK